MEVFLCLIVWSVGGALLLTGLKHWRHTPNVIRRLIRLVLLED